MSDNASLIQLTVPPYGLVLRGIFTLRKKELDWFYKKGASVIFPDKFLEFIEIIPENERHDLIKAYYKRLTSSNIQI